MPPAPDLSTTLVKIAHFNMLDQSIGNISLLHIGDPLDVER